MPKLTIDNREIEVPPGTTVLVAARSLGIDIPALCHREGCAASTSCLVCLVRIDHSDRLVPSCATIATDGMRVESESEPVHAARRTSLELLLSDHLGDCVAPCQFGCPAEMDIPTMLRQIARGELREAIATVKRDIALPAVLGRICTAPCEKVCRRGDLDTPVAICRLKQFVADVDLASADPYAPKCQAGSGKCVAIIGAGPTGLSAAYYLRQCGHTCTVIDQQSSAGGRLLGEPEDALPPDVLAAEIAAIDRLGIEWRFGKRIDVAAFAELQSRYDSVLVACGSTGPQQAGAWNLALGPRGIAVRPRTFEASVPGVFAAGTAIRGKALVVRSTADGKEAAAAIDQFLRGLPVAGPGELFSTKIGRMHGDELSSFTEEAIAVGQAMPDLRKFDFSDTRQAQPDLRVAASHAQRCLHCNCRGAVTCKLRKYASQYRAQPRRFKAERRVFQHDITHPAVVYEPGKCIACGLCIQIAEAVGEPLGLTLIGRGFDVRVAPPLGKPLSEALLKAAADCIAACPTAALAWKND